MKHCTNCDKEFDDETLFCPKCGSKTITQTETNKNESDSANDFSHSEQKSTNTNIASKKQKVCVFGFLIAILVLISSIMIPVAVSIKRKTTYKYIQYYMHNLERESHIYLSELIYSLPNNYRDIVTIRDEYEKIQTPLKNADFRFWKRGESFSKNVRKAYSDLYILKDELENWDIDGYLKKVHMLDLTFGVSLKYGEKYILIFYTNDGVETASTNFKKPFQEGQYYRAVINYNWSDNSFTVRYTNNGWSYLDGFKISNSSYDGNQFYVNLYVYAENKTYTLNFKDN